MNEKIIFISHSHKDAFISKAISRTLMNMGIKKESIFNTSHDDTKLDTGESIKENIHTALSKTEIGILILSKNYYDSPICLNEMGALWIKKAKILPILCKMSSKHLRGVIDSDTIYSTLHESSLSTVLETVSDEYYLNKSKSELFSYAKTIMDEIACDLDNLVEFDQDEKRITAKEIINSEEPNKATLVMYDFILKTNSHQFYRSDDEIWNNFINDNYPYSRIQYRTGLDGLIYNNQVTILKEDTYVYYQLTEEFKKELIRLDKNTRKKLYHLLDNVKKTGHI